MGDLVERVEQQPFVRRRNGRVEFAVCSVGLCQMLKRKAELPTQVLGVSALPRIKVGAVAQRESGEEIAAIQSDRFGERADGIGGSIGE